MNMLAYPGKERPWLQRLKGAAATLIIDSVLWVLFILLAVGGALGRSGAFFVVAMTGAFLLVGLFFGLCAKKQNDTRFFQGVIVATSLVLLLDVTCWGTLGLG
jgi:hypothetical protein